MNSPIMKLLLPMVMVQLGKLKSPKMPIKGVITSLTKVVMTAVKAAPITMPTARSTTFSGCNVIVNYASNKAGGESVAEACRAAGAQAIAAQARGELGRPDEFPPLVGPARQPTEHVFGPDDGEEIGLSRPVERRRDERATRIQQQRGGVEEGVVIGNVLDDLHRQYDIEPLAGCSKRLGSHREIVDGKPDLLGMGASRQHGFL